MVAKTAARAGHQAGLRRRHIKPLHLVFEPLEERALLSVAPVSQPWLVNSFTANSQKLAETGSAVAALPDGGFVVAWTSINQDGGGKGVFAARFDGAGCPAGSEFRVNSTTAGNQQSPSVAVGTDGTSIIVWQCPDGDGTGVFGQRFDGGGLPAGNEFRVNATTNGDQETPSAACLSDGSFVAVWAGKGEGDNSGVFGRLYGSDGVALGGEFLVNSQTDNAQGSPTVAALPSGGFVASWDSGGNQDGDGRGVFTQRFDALGARVSSEILVNTTTQGAQQCPAVGVGPGGEYAIAWQARNVDGSGLGIAAQRYSAMGEPVGGELLVNTTTSDDQQCPAVAYNDHGGFAIAWSGRGAGDNNGVFVREFGADGGALGSESRVNTATDGAQKYAKAAAAASGYVVCWSGAGQGDSDGVFGRRLGLGPTTTSIAEQEVEEDAGDTEINLWTVFEDAENSDNRLIYEVTGNTNASLLSPIIIDGREMHLVYAPDQHGTAAITVRATDPGGLFVETTFSVNVTSVNDRPVIEDFWDVPDPAEQGAMLRLEAVEVSDDGSVATVRFYRDGRVVAGSGHEAC